jgi:hypothetical protein
MQMRRKGSPGVGKNPRGRVTLLLLIFKKRYLSVRWYVFFGTKFACFCDNIF